MPAANNVYADIFEKLCDYNQQLFNTFAKQGVQGVNESPMQKALRKLNSEDMGKFADLMSQQPTQLVQNQVHWWQSQMQIWQNTMLKYGGQEVEPVVVAARDDRRFQDPAWEKEAIYDFIKQSYLLFCNTLLDSIKSAEGLDPEVQDRLEFFSRQTVNALAPSNFLATNPELLRLTIESNGQNLVKGFEQLQEDLQASADLLKVRMTPDSAFKVGENLASTPGDVVFKNDLFELIQYKPQTEKVFKKPLFIVPPYINKYYILDLKPKNSLVRWLVEQGHTVFLMSWRNPDASCANISFEDYVVDGVVAGLDAVEKTCGEREVHAMGYCIGGTLLTTSMAYMAAKRMKQRVKSATLLTTLLDFSNPGELGVYINDPIVSAIEAQNKENGFMDGRMMGVTFSMMRENTLYWNYYVDNYLKGQSPSEFDLLYWNSDCTNVAGACHNFMLRNLYLNNELVKPKKVVIKGTPVDLSKVKAPLYFLSTREDHIALWDATYIGSRSVGGDVTFVLGESGHIAGVINPPAKNKYGYWLGGTTDVPHEQWLDKATHHQGSWWEHWKTWHGKLETAEQVPARKAKDVLYTAPGQYVLQRLPITAES